jgi:hypothetical protein
MIFKALGEPARVLGACAVLALCSACQETDGGGLDGAYDNGGAGAGRVITADSGAVEIQGSDGLTVTGTTTTGVLTISGGADIAEPFAVANPETVLPGQVVVIDDANARLLRVSDRPYDQRVAGVVAGGGSLSPGLTLNRLRTGSSEQYVALTGLVYVRADATEGAIRAGDLLTTSSTVGHAMRVDNYERAQGAILGKAMEPLSEGTGLVLTLVTLQ